MVRLPPRIQTNYQSASSSVRASREVSDESSSSQEGRCYMAGRRATVRRRSELGNESTPSSPARIRARGGSSTDRVVMSSRRPSDANVSIVNVSSDDDDSDPDDIVDDDDDDDDSDDVFGDDNDDDSDQDVFEDSFIDDSLADTMSSDSGSLIDSFDSTGSITQPVRRGIRCMNNVYISNENDPESGSEATEYEPVDVDFTVPTVQDPNESLIKTAEHGDCPICFEDVSIDPVGCIYCRKFVGCRRCIQTWVKSGEAKKAQNSEADCENHDACPLCRHDWGHGVPEVESIFILEFQ